jgi:hypothetical protein
MVHSSFVRTFQQDGKKRKKRRAGRGNAAFSLFMRFLNSNRGTYEKLEIDATRTKQTLEVIPNRGNFCF